MRPMTNSELAAQQREINAKYGTKIPGMRTYPAQRAVEILGGRQIHGYDHSADIRDSNGGLMFTGTWAECVEWARAKGHLPPHMS